ncbi:hypothetical protein GCM10009727_44360 [Actinomadura napierensis]|uniref:Uncharacterized protein n=1 Tax=Actinomadura napierensis TaxID=267854 RepID=A0ABN2ZML1_9ACTN
MPPQPSSDPVAYSTPTVAAMATGTARGGIRLAFSPLIAPCPFLPRGELTVPRGRGGVPEGTWVRRPHRSQG